MKRLLIAAMLCCLCALSASAQVQYCMSYADYQADNWLELDSLSIKERRHEFRLKTGNDSIDKVLKNEAFAIFYNDTLLVNCQHIYYKGEQLPKGFVPAYVYANGKLCLVNSLPADNGATAIPVAIGGGLLGGLVGGAIAGAVVGLSSGRLSSENARCFLIRREYEDGRIDVQMIDDKFMEMYEDSSPEFYSEYMSVKKKKKREAASHVLPLLKEWQLVR